MEKFPQHNPENSPEEVSKEERIWFARELYESFESFSFPGLAVGVKEKLEQEEVEIPYYSKYATPINELLAEFTAQGMKVVLGKHPESGNVFIVPADKLGDNHDIENDSLFPRHLNITDDMDDRLKKLIQADKNKYGN